MRAGKRRHYLTVEQATETQDSAGEPVKSWGTYIRRWGSVQPMSGRELFASQQRWPEVDTRVELLADDRTVAITPKMRISVNGSVYNVLAVTNIEERGRRMRLMCRKEG